MTKTATGKAANVPIQQQVIFRIFVERGGERGGSRLSDQVDRFFSRTKDLDVLGLENLAVGISVAVSYIFISI